MSRVLRLVAAAMVWSLVAAVPAQADDPVLEWNLIAAQTTLTASPALAPIQQTRVMAIVQLAVHDAVNSVTRRFETYRWHRKPPAGASADAAAIGAAHAALVGLFPTQAAALQSAYDLSLPRHGVAATDPGLDFGRSVAETIVALRANDGAAAAQFAFIPTGAGTPGVWVPLGTQVALLAGWGNVTPFVLRSGSQFRPPAPPSLRSGRYARDYNEILEIGAANSLTRTTEQTNIAQFWRASPTAIWNQVLQQVVIARNLDLSSAARSMALMYAAASDSSVACWDAKFVYNFWRPQPAIVAGDDDGNRATLGDSSWLPLIPTPPHPDYPSGHGCNSAAMAHTMKLLFGNDPGITLVVTTSTAPVGFVRRWDTFTAGVDEVIEARIYSGIHFRTADEVGAKMGRQIARFVFTHALRERR